MFIAAKSNSFTLPRTTRHLTVFNPTAEVKRMWTSSRSCMAGYVVCGVTWSSRRSDTSCQPFGHCTLGVPALALSSYNHLSDVDCVRCCARIPIRIFLLHIWPSAGCTAWCVRGAIAPTCPRACVPTCSVAINFILRLSVPVLRVFKPESRDRDWPH